MPNPRTTGPKSAPGRWPGRVEQRGELKGRRNALKQLLGARFGELAQEALARIDAATAKDLDAMVLRVLTANTLDEVLGVSTGSE
ncbi:MAG: hypothetical protein IPM54_42240 [Polyangiaceae bacterium]|nr:hypothetical protein [Polyangiaceae bacterium]